MEFELKRAYVSDNMLYQKLNKLKFLLLMCPCKRCQSNT